METTEMFDWLTSETLAVVSVAALFGGMLFFSGVMAPLVFIKLPAATAGGFIRELFPWYYLAMGVLALAAFVFLVTARAQGLVAEWAAMGTVLTGFVIARQWLMPRINLARDAALAGDSGQSGRFKRLHSVSVAINTAQLVLCLAVLIRLV